MGWARIMTPNVQHVSVILFSFPAKSFCRFPFTLRYESVIFVASNSKHT